MVRFFFLLSHFLAVQDYELPKKYTSSCKCAINSGMCQNSILIRLFFFLLQLLTWWCSCRSSHPVVFLVKGVLKICSKFTGEHPCRSVISIKLLCNFIEITLRHGCSPVKLLHIFRTPFTKNTSERLFCSW